VRSNSSGMTGDSADRLEPWLAPVSLSRPHQQNPPVPHCQAQSGDCCCPGIDAPGRSSPERLSLTLAAAGLYGRANTPTPAARRRRPAPPPPPPGAPGPPPVPDPPPHAPGPRPELGARPLEGVVPVPDPARRQPLELDVVLRVRRRQHDRLRAGELEQHAL